MIALLISLLIIVAIVWVAFWIVDSAFPEPIRMVAKIIIGILALLFLLHLIPGTGIAL